MMTPSQLGRGVVVPALLLAFFVASCSVQDATPLPSCGQGDSALIAAQSVPTAQMLPCLTHLPLGWDVDAVDITQDGTTIRFDSDRAGHHAAELVFAEMCDPTGAAQQQNDQDGVERFARTERVEPGLRAKSFHVFEGGCVTWSFDFDNDVPRSELDELDDTLVLHPRSAAQDGFAEFFPDRDL
jgi:hypothetical protein